MGSSEMYQQSSQSGFMIRECFQTRNFSHIGSLTEVFFITTSFKGINIRLLRGPSLDLFIPLLDKVYKL